MEYIECTSGTSGRTYFDDSRLVCLVSVHKPMVHDRLKFKTGQSNGQNEQVLRDLAILVSLVSYEKNKNLLAR